MPIRKNRVVHQGVSNQPSLTIMRNHSSFNLTANQSLKNLNHTKNKSFNLSQSFSKYDTPKMTMTQHHPFYLSGIEQNLNQKNLSQIANHKEMQLTKKQYKPNNTKKTEQNIQMSENTSKVLERIRATYRQNANVRKISKGWGFQSKGYISKEQFQQIIRDKFDNSITKQNCEEMLKSVNSNRQNIDMLTFVKLVFEQQPFTKPKINVLDYQQTLQKKKLSSNMSSTLIGRISNLNEGSIVHGKKNQVLENNSVVLPDLSETNKQKTKSKLLQMSSNQQFQKSQPSLYQSIHSASSPKFSFVTTKSHGVQFNPKLFYGVNQQKTRFGATPEIPLNDQSLFQNKREKIFDSKQRVMEDLNASQNFEKMRYMNKLQRIRQHQEKEKQNILALDRRVQERENANMRKLREQNLAYNYVSFIHNDWK